MKKTAKLILVNTTELRELLGGVCYRTAVRIGEDAGAKFMVGSSPRWYVDKVENYIRERLEGK